MNDIERILNQWLEEVPDRICFIQKMKVYAPTCDGACEQEVLKLRDKLNFLFGGSTTYESATGCFIKKDQQICEPIKVIEVAHNCSDKDTLKRLVTAITDYATNTKQESVSIHNGTFYIAETPELVKKLEEFELTQK